jgi:hypothetical protein
VLADLADTTPPPHDDFGFHHDLASVQMAVFGAEHWHVLPYPGGLFDQPETLLWDMIRYINLRDEVRNPDNPVIYAPPDAYEDQETEIKRTTL